MRIPISRVWRDTTKASSWIPHAYSPTFGATSPNYLQRLRDPQQQHLRQNFEAFCAIRLSPVFGNNAGLLSSQG
jgi:hypothetical protein